MPRFFFDISDGAATSRDSIGLDLLDARIAREEATRTLSEIAAQELPGDGPRRKFRIVVRDNDGAVLFEVRLDFSTTESGTSEWSDNDAAGD